MLVGCNVILTLQALQPIEAGAVLSY